MNSSINYRGNSKSYSFFKCLYHQLQNRKLCSARENIDINTSKTKTNQTNKQKRKQCAKSVYVLKTIYVLTEWRTASTYISLSPLTPPPAGCILTRGGLINAGLTAAVPASRSDPLPNDPVPSAVPPSWSKKGKLPWELRLKSAADAEDLRDEPSIGVKDPKERKKKKKKKKKNSRIKSSWWTRSIGQFSSVQNILHLRHTCIPHAYHAIQMAKWKFAEKEIKKSPCRRAFKQHGATMKQKLSQQLHSTHQFDNINPLILFSYKWSTTTRRNQDRRNTPKGDTYTSTPTLGQCVSHFGWENTRTQITGHLPRTPGAKHRTRDFFFQDPLCDSVD